MRVGSIRVVSADGGEARGFDQSRGHYVDPVFSPRRIKIVYGKITGELPLLAGITPRSRASTGCRAREGRRDARIREAGNKPAVRRGQRPVYLVRSEPDKENDNTKLISIGLNGTEGEPQRKRANATEIINIA